MRDFVSAGLLLTLTLMILEHQNRKLRTYGARIAGHNDVQRTTRSSQSAEFRARFRASADQQNLDNDNAVEVQPRYGASKLGTIHQAGG